MQLKPKNNIFGTGASIGGGAFLGGGGGFGISSYLLTEIEIASLALPIGVAAAIGGAAIGFSINHFIKSVFNNRE